MKKHNLQTGSNTPDIGPIIARFMEVFELRSHAELERKLEVSAQCVSKYFKTNSPACLMKIVALSAESDPVYVLYGKRQQLSRDREHELLTEIKILRDNQRAILSGRDDELKSLVVQCKNALEKASQCHKTPNCPANETALSNKGREGH